jgi:hypothetical protein
MRTLIVCLVVLATACAPKSSPRPAPAPPPAAPASAAPEAPPPTSLRVDHAWVKDADDPAEQAARTTAIATLRAKATAGERFVAAWEALGVDGEPWHVAEGETYPYDVLPAEARSLPDGAVSAVIPGNGGQHLFRILGRD